MLKLLKFKAISSENITDDRVQGSGFRVQSGIGRISIRISAAFPIIMLFIIILSGCVSRNLSIRTPDDSEKYEVYLDGAYAGTTPYTSEFLFYGTREVLLKGPEGGISVFDIPLRRPWYQFFPLDFFAEVLYPAQAQHSIEITLAPEEKKAPDLAAVRERADSFRAEFRKRSNADK